MIDTYVIILKSYADRTVPGSSMRTHSLWIYEDVFIDLLSCKRVLWAEMDLPWTVCSPVLLPC